MIATLLAFPVFGFFAATLLSLARILVIVAGAAAAVAIVSLWQGAPSLKALGLGFADLALSQMGSALGLVWVASTRGRTPED